MNFLHAIELSIQENNLLTPKGLACVFWQHKNFGWIHVTGDLHILG